MLKRPDFIICQENRNRRVPVPTHPEHMSPPLRPRRSSSALEKPSKPELEPEAVSNFFRRLNSEKIGPFSREETNPMEEMFRLFGGELCSKHPENCDRYLKSYKDIRSKSSHISPLRDPYDLKNLHKTVNVAPVEPEMFPLGKSVCIIC